MFGINKLSIFSIFFWIDIALVSRVRRSYAANLQENTHAEERFKQSCLIQLSTFFQVELKFLLNRDKFAVCLELFMGQSRSFLSETCFRKSGNHFFFLFSERQVTFEEKRRLCLFEKVLCSFRLPKLFNLWVKGIFY